MVFVQILVGKCPDWSGAYSSSCSMVTRCHWPGRKLTAHLHLLPRLRMSGSVPLLPIYAFIDWTGKTLPFCINLDELIKWVVKISKRNISFHKLKAVSYVCLVCHSKVVAIFQQYNGTHDRNRTAMNVRCL
jgi:hypothetical protein